MKIQKIHIRVKVLANWPYLIKDIKEAIKKDFTFFEDFDIVKFFF